MLPGLGLVTPANAVRAPLESAVVTAALDPDPSDRESMRRGYLEILKPAMEVPIDWTGDLASCDPGAPSPAAQDATLTAVNYFRDLVGVEPVVFDIALSAEAQQAALMMARNGQLSHDPPETWDCWTAEGSDAAGKSNLARGMTGASAVAGYMDDTGSGDTQAGHRRWIIDPRQTTMGSGSVRGGEGWETTANALYVLDTNSWQPIPAETPEYLPWPPAGYVPIQIEPNGRWSLSVGRGASLGSTRVTVNGSSSGITVHPMQDGAGPETLVWDFDPGFEPGDPDRTYRVVVDGIQQGDVVSGYAYDVTLFDAEAAPGDDLDPPVLTPRYGEFAVRLRRGNFEWQASDPSGVRDYQLRRSVRLPGSAYDPWRISDWFTSDAARWAFVRASRGDTWCVSARARDASGNVTAWSAPRCVHMPVDDDELSATRSWRTVHAEDLWKGSALRSEQSGATLKVLGAVGIDRVGIVASQGPGCGKVAVYVGKMKVGTLSLQGQETKDRVVMLLPRLVTPFDGTVKVVVESTGRPVVIDGIVATGSPTA